VEHPADAGCGVSAPTVSLLSPFVTYACTNTTRVLSSLDICRFYDLGKHTVQNDSMTWFILVEGSVVKTCIT
jgi:hypothetical protein